MTPASQIWYYCFQDKVFALLSSPSDSLFARQVELYVMVESEVHDLIFMKREC